jgi:hypothetical protein
MNCTNFCTNLPGILLKLHKLTCSRSPSGVKPQRERERRVHKLVHKLRKFVQVKFVQMEKVS